MMDGAGTAMYLDGLVVLRVDPCANGVYERSDGEGYS